MCSSEEEIESSLSQYKAQIIQIDDALKQSFSEDLLQLRSDMLELIKLTEESLLSLKKSQLLAMLEASTDGNETIFDKPMSQVVTSECNKSGRSNDDDDDDDSADDGLVGFKCRAPFSHGWGELSYHNAMVFSIEPRKDDGQQMVRLLFCNPTHNSMKFCPYLCNGHCKFEDDTCKFSHGHVIPVSNLEPFKEPNFENVSIGSKCLAKDSDELWYKATIVDLIDDEKIQVMFDANHSLNIVELSDIYPTSEDSEDEEQESSVEENEANDDDVIPPAEEEIYLNIQTSDVLGQWEKHTKGIGSKLMLKMGYVIGQGLGKNCDGRAVPVPIEVLPRGMSLDKIMEGKVKKKHPNMNKTKVKMPNKSIESNKATAASVFDVINSKLLLHNKTQGPSKLKADDSATYKDPSKISDKQINIQLRKTAEELRRSDEELRKLKYSLERNIQRGDGVTAKKFQEKIQKLVWYQDVLKKSEKSLNRHKNLRKSRRTDF